MGGDVLVAVDGLAYGLLLFAVAAGLTLTLGVAKVLNLAHGTFFLGGAYLGWWLIAESWTGLALAILASAAAGGLAGAGLASLLTPLRHQLDQALATIGVSLLLGHALTLGFGAEPLAVDPPASVAGTVDLLGQPYPIYRLVFTAAALVLAVGLWLLVAHSRPGMAIRASADDPEMAACLGISPNLVRTLVMAGGGALAAAIGASASALLGPAPGGDHNVLISSLVVVITGGAGSVPGALAAALVVGQAQTTVLANLPTAAPYAPYLMLIAVLAVRSVVERRAALS